MLNRFGKQNYESETSNSAAIAAGEGWNFQFTAEERKNFRPMTNLKILNRSTSNNIQISFNAIIDGNNDVSSAIGQTRTEYLTKGTGLEMTWKDDRIICYRLVIKNISLGEIAIGEIIIKFSNYTS